MRTIQKFYWDGDPKPLLDWVSSLSSPGDSDGSNEETDADGNGAGWNAGLKLGLRGGSLVVMNYDQESYVIPRGSWVARLPVAGAGAVLCPGGEVPEMANALVTGRSALDRLVEVTSTCDACLGTGVVAPDHTGGESPPASREQCPACIGSGVHVADGTTLRVLPALISLALDARALRSEMIAGADKRGAINRVMLGSDRVEVVTVDAGGDW